MADASAVGKEGATFELVVERGKVREFARAVRATHPAYFEGEHVVSPPTFLTTMFFWEEHVANANPWHEVKLDPKRGMHAEQEYVFHGEPPRAGTRLLCRSKIESVFAKEGKRGGKLTFAVMKTEMRDERGKLVAEAILTGVETEQVTVQAQAQAQVQAQAQERAPMTFGPVTRTDFVRYQGASGDMNPIHHDEEFARAAGYHAPLAVGMFQAGVLCAWAASHFGPENVRRTKIRWKDQVWPGDVLTCNARVVKEDEGSIDVELECTKQTGAVAVQSWMTFAKR
jgi:acyl dehydratase